MAARSHARVIFPSAIRKIRCRRSSSRRSSRARRASLWRRGRRRAFDVVRSLESIDDVNDVFRDLRLDDNRRVTDDINPNAEQYEEYRHGVRELCARFDSKYWQSVDEEPRISGRIRQRADAMPGGSRR